MDDSNSFDLRDISSVCDELVDALISFFFPAQATTASLAHAIIKMPHAVRDYFLYRKLYHFIEAIKVQSPDEAIRFGTELFSDDETVHENGFRLLQYIDKAETLSIIDFIVNAARAVGTGLISKSEFFRVVWVLTNTFYEDLQYFKKIATCQNAINGSTQVIALARSGLMISSGIDANSPIEEQEYAVTKLGRFVDKCALSFGDDDRQNEWKMIEMNSEKKIFQQ